MSYKIIKGGKTFNRGKSYYADLLIHNGRIELIANDISKPEADIIDATGKYIFPGIIDDQVHFREPGLTHKADIASESRAAVAGGTTTFMEMPNTVPNTLTQELLQIKYDIASGNSYTNYSFFMGAGNDNLEEVLKTNPKNVCGIKAFMGSSTGNMLVDNPVTLEQLFSRVGMLIATHCEDESTIRKNASMYAEQFGNDLQAKHHPEIRNVEGCYLSSSLAVDLATKHNSRLHILHISTAKELDLFHNDKPLNNKRITAEVCVHHLNFDATQYNELGNRIKCNPAIKAPEHKEALLEALLDDRLDIIATDHAPHTWDEKSRPYSKAPSGLPLVQHSLDMMMNMHHDGKISIEKIIEKMCHAPAECFNIVDRGYLDEGKYADIVIYDPSENWTVNKENILFKCGWSPLEGKTFKGRVEKTLVNGEIVYDANKKNRFVQGKGMRLTFDRPHL